ncbi:uncharacterized protein LOC112175817 [Rosa chinensis]|uniref:uncharacterized protein LOC112175817 n=1 Tax=Rosa chinensis TaxID=74649 RepID=UPI000D0966CA|nr:uncharacterized protein LOC112175817 [Rosa chinensis]XP_040368180.1 uncharacterized protein LOC112175817 [Rosa chinensis]
MENNEGGVCYTDHLYHSSFPSDEEVSDDDGLLQIGEDEEGFFCDGGEKGLGHTSEIGNDKCHLMDMETLDGTNIGGCVDLNGKDYSNLNMDDMKDVVFSSVCEAEKFYHLYSRVIGFSTRKDRKVRAYRSEFVIRREWVCSKQGKATINAKKQGLKEKGKTLIQAEKKKMKRNQCPRGKRYSRVGCMAGFGIRYCKERKKYFVSKFITNHNHDVAVSEEVQFLRSHRGVTDSVIAQVEALQKAQVHISRIYENFGSMLVFSHSQNHSWVINEKVSKFSCSIAPRFLISNADTDILLLSDGTSRVEWLYPMVSNLTVRTLWESITLF